MPKPFKGTFFYEWQIGSWVFQWRHKPAFELAETKGFRHGRIPGRSSNNQLFWELWIGRFMLWNDTMWEPNRFVLWLRNGGDSIW